MPSKFHAERAHSEYKKRIVSSNFQSCIRRGRRPEDSLRRSRRRDAELTRLYFEPNEALKSSAEITTTLAKSEPRPGYAAIYGLHDIYYGSARFQACRHLLTRESQPLRFNRTPFGSLAPPIWSDVVRQVHRDDEMPTILVVYRQASGSHISYGLRWSLHQTGGLSVR